ncbi:MAG TPA: hypothetical protein VMT51_07640 [Dongiaceae bacterium]|nr:hypothetical protein [Dongiaceae bacterium]
MPALKETLRNVRLVHLGFLALVAVVFLAATQIRQQPRTMPVFFPAVLAFVALADIGVATLLRVQRLKPAAERLRASPEDPRAQRDWRNGNILSFVFALTTALFGMVTHVLGFSMNVAAWFFVTSFLLLLLWWPRLEPQP